MGAAIIPCCYAPPVFEFAKHVFNFVALFVEFFIVLMLHLAVLAGRNAGCNPFVDQLYTEPVAVISPVGQQMLAVWQSLDDQSRSFVITHLPLGQEHDDGPARSITNGMKLGIQTAFGSTDTAGNSPFLSRLAAVRCALRCVASI